MKLIWWILLKADDYPGVFAAIAVVISLAIVWIFCKFFLIVMVEQLFRCLPVVNGARNST